MGYKNPFITRKEVKEFDRFEAKSGIYRNATKKLIRQLPEIEGRIVDIGCGTGNSTLALLDKYRGKYNSVTAIDRSAEQVRLAKIKFGIGTESIKDVDDEELFNFFVDFQQEAFYLRKNGNDIHLRVKFIEDSAENAHMHVADESVELVAGNHIWHWLIRQETEDDAIETVWRILEDGGILAFNTSAHFMNPCWFEIEDVSVFNHPLTLRYLDNLSERIIEIGGKEIQRPGKPEPIIEREEKIKQFEDSGFELLMYEEYLVSIANTPETGKPDFVKGSGILCNYHFRVWPKNHDWFKGVPVTDEEAGFIVEEAIAKTIKDAGKDLEHEGHVYDVNPRFVFRKT